MDKVNDTIKNSCENLLSKNLIDRDAYNNCLQVIKKQKWREFEKDVPNLDSFAARETNNYEKFKKILDSNFKLLLDAKDPAPFLTNIANVEKNIKKKLEEFTENQESQSIFREYTAKHTVNKNLHKEIEKQMENIDFLEEKRRQLTEDMKLAGERKQAYIILTCIGILLVLIISFVIIYGKNNQTNKENISGITGDNQEWNRQYLQNMQE